MFSFKRSLIALLGLLSLCGVEARADAFVITNVGGTLFLTTSDLGGPPTQLLPPVFNLIGPWLTVTTVGFNTGGDIGNVQARDLCRSTACVPGTVIGTNSTFSGTIAGPLGAVAIVNGVTYPLFSLTGSLNFFSPPIVLPNFGTGPQLLTVPFSFSGSSLGEAAQPGVPIPIFTATLSGQGLATLRFEDINRNPLNPQYMLLEIGYQFQPVPEAGDAAAAILGVDGRSGRGSQTAQLSTQRLLTATLEHISYAHPHVCCVQD